MTRSCALFRKILGYPGYPGGKVNDEAEAALRSSSGVKAAPLLENAVPELGWGGVGAVLHNVVRLSPGAAEPRSSPRGCEGEGSVSGEGGWRSRKRKRK